MKCYRRKRNTTKNIEGVTSIIRNISLQDWIQFLELFCSHALGLSTGFPGKQLSENRQWTNEFYAFLPLFRLANDLPNEIIWSSSDIHRIVKALMIIGYHNRRVSQNEFEWKSTIDERIPQARGSSEIRQCWEGCNATEALFTSQLNYFLRLI